MPPFEWDEAKNASNLIKHGISFDEATLIFEGSVLTVPDVRFDYGESRSISIGSIQSVVFVSVVHTERNGSIRIISARLANRTERRLYREHFPEASSGTSEASGHEG